jgi:hypothetical protein
LKYAQRDIFAALEMTDNTASHFDVISAASTVSPLATMAVGNVGGKNWVILERSGRLLQKDISPIKESETFVIFDEPRCRGTDLKLRSDAIGLLTLAPKLCKDKIMQAAGRLQKLGGNQRLVIAGGPDVFSKLPGSTTSSGGLSRGQKDRFEATVSQVLSWSMKNTVEVTSEGLLNWANQGLFFSSTFGKDPKFCITEEVIKLEDMYGKSFAEETVSKHTDGAHQYHMNRTGGQRALHSSVKGMVDLILEQVSIYGRVSQTPLGGAMKNVNVS